MSYLIIIDPSFNMEMPTTASIYRVSGENAILKLKGCEFTGPARETASWIRAVCADYQSVDLRIEENGAGRVLLHEYRALASGDVT